MHELSPDFDFLYHDDNFNVTDHGQLTSRPENLTNWQWSLIANFSLEGQSCMMDFWSATKPEGPFCNATWDEHICWPATSPNTTVTRSCPVAESFETIDSQINISDTFAHRTCNATGHWQHGSWTNYTLCILTMLIRLSESQRQKIFYYRTKSSPESDGKAAYIAAILTHIYFYGGVISCFFLVITLFIFSYFRMLQCCRISIHKNLVVSFIVRFVVIAVFFEPFVFNRSHSYRDLDWLCKLLNVFVQYTLLANVAWMFVEGLFLHGRVTISVFNAHPPFKIYYCIGWGMPGLIVTIWAICMSQLNAEKCWNRWFKMPTSWIITAPVIAALGINLIFLVNIIRIMMTKLGASHTVEVDRVRKAVKATTVLFPLLGMTNILFLFEPTEGAAYRVTNAVLQSSQGIFVSVIYCFLNDEVKAAIQKKWQRYRNRRFDTDESRRRSSSTKINAKGIATSERMTRALQTNQQMPDVIKLDVYKVNNPSAQRLNDAPNDRINNLFE